MGIGILQHGRGSNSFRYERLGLHGSFIEDQPFLVLLIRREHFPERFANPQVQTRIAVGLNVSNDPVQQRHHRRTTDGQIRPVNIRGGTELKNPSGAPIAFHNRWPAYFTLFLTFVRAGFITQHHAR